MGYVVMARHGEKLAGLPWLGGKPASSTSGLNQWICGLLPWPHKYQTYVEPFAGQLGILLAREPAGIELANDLDYAVVNFWRAIRFQAEEMASYLQAFPTSRYEHAQAWAECQALAEGYADSGPPEHGDLVWACAWAAAQSQAVSGQIARWSRSFAGRGSKANAGAQVAKLPAKVLALAGRLKRVQLECADAIDVIARAGREPQALIYADPPYLMGEKHYACKVDQEALDGALLAAGCPVAVSGYRGDRDALEAAGWQRHEYEMPLHGAGRNGHRTECLWTNYEPGKEGRLF